MKTTRRLNRRDFLRTSAFGAGAGLALPNIFLNHTLAATGENPSELVRVGFIGVGGQGTSNMRALMKNVAAVCDVDKTRAKTAASLVEKANGRAPAVFHDYQELLEDKSIDAVLISTPDHWHALPAIHACQAGKDVYCEKPLTLAIEEGQRLVKAVHHHKRILQTGSQQRSDPKFLTACQYVRSGRLGKIKRVIVGLPGVNWTTDPPAPDGEPPAELDYNLWLGPAPWRPYNKHRVHYYFRFFWDYSGGQMTNWGAHHLDITQWALGMDDSGPVEIEGNAQFNAQKLYEVPEKFDIIYRYPQGTVVECKSPYPKTGCLFEGEKGTLYVTRGNIESNPESILDEPLSDHDVHLYKSTKHHQNWIDCIKSRKPPICDVTVGHRSATVCHLGNIAIRVGRKIKWDPVTEQIIGDPDASRWITKPYRAPWKLPQV